jgi:general secretion pathway protein I
MSSRSPTSAAGFTLVEVLVALMVIALGLAALMIAVSGTARTSGMLRDKTIAGWIALNRLAEVRLNLTKFGQNNDTGELDFANRKWHYDTRYFNTSINSMKRVVVRVYAGDLKTKGNPLIESVGFTGTQISPAGTSNTVLWTKDSGPAALQNGPGSSSGGLSSSSSSGSLGVSSSSGGISTGSSSGGLSTGSSGGNTNSISNP